ncbi:MAG: hypothetical protein RML93_11595 [Anaerolineales bacterium]|nr:hypothetical protein [Anaerolineales bacterium]MDW8447918.1 hypothetical protein [Anaerolineales bacterium]
MEQKPEEAQAPSEKYERKNPPLLIYYLQPHTPQNNIPATQSPDF